MLNWLKSINSPCKIRSYKLDLVEMGVHSSYSHFIGKACPAVRGGFSGFIGRILLEIGNT
jgi:hypothetical protein